MRILLVLGLLYAATFAVKVVAKGYFKKDLNLAESFVVLFAAFELVALPFMLTNASYGALLAAVSFFATLLLVATILKIDFKNSSIPKKKLLRHLKDPFFIIFAALALLAIGTSTYLQRLNLDDSYYLGLAEQSIDAPALYSFDPSAGIESLPIQPYYAVQSWELGSSILADTSGLDVASVSHTAIPLLVIPLALVATYGLFRELGLKKYIFAAMTVSVVYLLFSGHSSSLEGSFLLDKPWYGKSLVFTILIPLLLKWCVAFYKKRNTQSVVMVAIIALAGVGLNPSAMYILAIPIAIFTGLSVLKHRNIKSAQLIAGLVPIAILAAIIYPDVSSFNDEWALVANNTYTSKSFFRELRTFTGEGGFTYIGAAGILFSLLFFKKEKRALFGLYPLALIVFVVNPFVAPLWAEYITTQLTYWRVLWLFPTLYFTGYATVWFIKRYHTAFRGAQYFITAVAVLVIVLNGAYLFAIKNKPFVPASNLQKIPTGIVQAADILENKDNVHLLSPKYPSGFIRSQSSNIMLLWSRKNYMLLLKNTDENEYRTRKALFETVQSGELAIDNFNEEAEKLGVNWLMYADDNLPIDTHLRETTDSTYYDLDGYVLVEVKSYSPSR